MFPSTYDTPDYFPPSYFPEHGADAAPGSGLYYAPSYYPADFYAPSYFPGTVAGSAGHPPAPPPASPLCRLLCLILARRNAAAPAPDFMDALVAYLRGLPAVGGALGTDAWGNVKIYLDGGPAGVPYPLMIITPITTMDVMTNSPTTAWKIKRVQYDVFATTDVQDAALGQAAYSALSPVSPMVTYATGYEFLRRRLSHGEPKLVTLSGRGGLPEYRYLFEIQHQVGELY